ncbi:MAG: hypothetical protein AAF721_18215, partial [Myxococcota bacterium]
MVLQLAHAMAEALDTQPFWSAFGPPDPAASRAQVDARLAEFVRAGAAAHDELRVDMGAYLEHLGQRCAQAGSLALFDRVDPPEQFLAFACGGGDPTAARRFEQLYFNEVGVGASRLRCSDDELDEIRQRVRTAVFGRDGEGRV